jgi:hypothetical protein
VRKHGLDRRHSYSVYGNHLVRDVRITLECSGCSCDCHPCCGPGAGGCQECGYTGKRRTWTWDPCETVEGEYIVVPKRKVKP